MIPNDGRPSGLEPVCIRFVVPIVPVLVRLRVIAQNRQDWRGICARIR
jgi:hypothetical protein